MRDSERNTGPSETIVNKSRPLAINVICRVSAMQYCSHSPVLIALSDHDYLVITVFFLLALFKNTHTHARTHTQTHRHTHTHTHTHTVSICLILSKLCLTQSLEHNHVKIMVKFKYNSDHISMIKSELNKKYLKKDKWRVFGAKHDEYFVRSLILSKRQYYGHFTAP